MRASLTYTQPVDCPWPPSRRWLKLPRHTIVYSCATTTRRFSSNLCCSAARLRALPVHARLSGTLSGIQPQRGSLPSCTQRRSSLRQRVRSAIAVLASAALRTLPASNPWSWSDAMLKFTRQTRSYHNRIIKTGPCCNAVAAPTVKQLILEQHVQFGATKSGLSFATTQGKAIVTSRSPVHACLYGWSCDPTRVLVRRATDHQGQVI